MKTSVQARLGEESAAALETLERCLGLSQSEIVRASLRLMLQQQAPMKPGKIIGRGEFDSGVTDLAANKKHRESFVKNPWAGDEASSARQRCHRRLAQ
jgi:hypothetical protein